MRTATVLLACLLCVATLACRPNPAGRVAAHSAREMNQQMRGHGLRRDCRAEIEQYCAADQTGRDRRLCLESHLDQLSADCKTALAARGQKGGRWNRDRNRQGGQDQQ